ncbi:phage holin family protein [Algoriphagus aquimarinus]|uniref:Putative membrane protein n=1 Tax=Algoriphagus aquimarinus TaxID=237018 RepID=A0A1I0YDK0_9BACT|nr:phage holin family protein [Algoriphagus aquimarinus]SFB11232.1 putative membrane protein [Algoriphagus aquimarinus]
MNFLVKILLGGISVIIAEYLIPGIHIDTAVTGFILAAFIILINITLKPILIVLTLPITILTLGLFLLVINALMFMLADRIIPGFQVDGFWWAVLFAIVVSIINSLFGNSLNPSKPSQ